MSNNKENRTSLLEDLLFRRRLQRNLNSELERLNGLLVEQIRLLQERKALMAEAHDAIQKCWREQEDAEPSVQSTAEEDKDAG